MPAGQQHWVTNRRKRRMPCRLRAGASVHRGLVLDLSPTGLFVQTSAKTRAGQQIGLDLSTDEGEAMDLVVEVVRKKVVPARLLTVAQGGVGVRILSAPERYFQFLGGIGIAGGAPGIPPAPASSTPRFRVRVSQTSGPRSRRLDLKAADASAASEAALEQVGDGWKVLDVEAL